MLSWLAASSTVVVAPVLEGEPMTASVVYSAPLLVLSLLLATVAGVLAVLGAAAASLARPKRHDSWPLPTFLAARCVSPLTRYWYKVQNL